jgi:regulator of replication initiation timing
LENLSPELTRNFKLIYELDNRVHEIMKEIDKLKADYLANMKTMNNSSRLEMMKLIDKKFEKCKEFSDEKVQLANQTYEMVKI